MIPPGAEGIANLVFDVPRIARGVKGGWFEGEEEEGERRKTESLFEIRCCVQVRLGMGITRFVFFLFLCFFFFD